MSSSLASISFALILAIFLGPLLGRVATHWFSGRGFSNLLIELKGVFLPFIVAPLLHTLTGWRSWIIIGLVVGFMRGVSVARWIVRRTGDWSPAMAGGIALGRSRSSLLSQQATARGAVVGTLATTTINVVLLEALLSALNLPGLDVSGTVGASLQVGSASAILLFLLGGTLCLILSETLASWFLQKRRTP